jgi:hypothetical protein
MSVLNLYPTVRPTLSFDFVNAGVLDPSVTFTRPTSATYFDETGILRVANPNTPRFDFNPSTLAAQGFLIEEARTNLVLQSADFSTTWTVTGATITTNSTTSPDGTSNADSLVEDGTTGLHLTQQFITFANATTYTVSLYVKASTRTWVQVLLPSAAFTASQGGFFNLSGAGSLGTTIGSPTSRTITAISNGWYRITVTATSTAAAGGNVAITAASADNTASYAGSSGSTALFLFGAQLEAGAFPTSYIPTTTTALTRSADVASVNTLSPWYNAAEGTVYAECVLNAFATTQQAAWRIDDTTDNERMFVRRNGSTVQYVGIDGGVTQWSLNTGNTVTVGTPFKHAAAYKVNDIASAFNGGNILTATTATLPTVTLMRLGGENGGAYLNGTIRRITYYPVRLTNAQLQNLTA